MTSVDAVRVDDASAEERAAALFGALPTGAERVAALKRIVPLLDLTSLSGTETAADIRALCERALRPIAGARVAAVCVYRQWIGQARSALGGSGVRVAAVAGGFPEGVIPLEEKVAEVRECVEAGADEVDVVITRSLAQRGEWQALYDELRAFREACGAARLKVIVAAGDLGSLTAVARASLVAMQAGADFVKTSTGKERVNATPANVLVMALAIREFHAATGQVVGLKPAGGIRTADQALGYCAVLHGVLGDDWFVADRLRLGASALLDDIERELSGA